VTIILLKLDAASFRAPRRQSKQYNWYLGIAANLLVVFIDNITATFAAEMIGFIKNYSKAA